MADSVGRVDLPHPIRVAAHRIYEEEARPADRADFVVANDDPAAPTLTA